MCALNVEYFVQQFERFRKWSYIEILTNALNMFLGFPTVLRPQNNAHRVGLAIVLLACIVYVCVVDAMVVKIITSTFFGPQIGTINEILDKNLDLIGSEFALQKLMQQYEVHFALCRKYLFEA